MEPIKRLYTYADMCRQLNCSERHVRSLLADGKLKALRSGKRVMITGESLEQYLASMQPVVYPKPMTDQPANGAKRSALLR